MYIKTDTQRVQRILTATVMAAAIMSALSACGGGGGGGSKSAGLPGTNIPTNPAAACRATPAPRQSRKPGNPDPGGPTTPTTTPARCKPPWAIPARPWTTSCP